MNNELQTYDLGKPSQTLALASELSKFIKERNLSVNIKGKEFVQVDGWQFAGSQLGVVPVLLDLIDLSKDNEVKYRATVELRRLSDDRIVGKGIAICSNKEGMKKNFEEYAIASMAQTRAEGKAFRMLVSWLMKAAGYETTPAEEADSFERQDMPSEEEKDLLRKLVFSSNLDAAHKQEAQATIDGCKNFSLYMKIQSRLEELQPSIDEIPNPSQTDIKKHLRKTVKA